jgi:hypothetical protein
LWVKLEIIITIPFDDRIIDISNYYTCERLEKWIFNIRLEKILKKNDINTMSYFDTENSMDDDLDYQFQTHYSKNSNQKTVNNSVTLSKISEIDPSTPVMYNNANVFVERRSSGKTYTCIKELIKIFRDSERTHLLVYISKNPNIIDPIFNELGSFMRFPIVFVSADEADEYIKHIIAYKTAYERSVKVMKI